MRQADSIHSERKALRNVTAVFSHSKIQPELVSNGYQFSLRYESSTLWVAHFDAQLSPILLCRDWKSKDAHGSQNADDSSNERVHHFMKRQGNLIAAHPTAKVHP